MVLVVVSLTFHLTVSNCELLLLFLLLQVLLLLLLLLFYFFPLRFRESCQVLSSDSSGRVSFSLPLSSLPSNITKLSLLATAVDRPANATTGMKAVEAKLDLPIAHGNATSAVSVFTTDKARIGNDRGKLNLRRLKLD